jgi:hypothetical protein
MFNSGVLLTKFNRNTISLFATYFRASIRNTQDDNEINSSAISLAKMGKGKELRTPERRSAFLMLESMSKDGVLERGLSQLWAIYFKQLTEEQCPTYGEKSV